MLRKEGEDYDTHNSRCAYVSKKIKVLLGDYLQYLSRTVPFEHNGELPKETASLIRRLASKYINKDKPKTANVDQFLSTILKDSAVDTAITHVDVFDMVNFLADIKAVTVTTISPVHGELIYNAIYNYGFNIFVKGFYRTLVEKNWEKRQHLVELTREYLNKLIEELTAELIHGSQNPDPTTEDNGSES